MSINLTVPNATEHAELKPRITVVGVGGAGGNAVNNMITRQLEGVDFVVANTDAQSLTQSAAERRIQLGTHLTQGLGAGSKPDVGRGAAEEAIEDVVAELNGAHMAFIAAGMGGGTGTGAAPVIAKAAREAGILTVGVVTKPFQFEGSHRMKIAEEGIEELGKHVDTLIIIPNQNLFRIANENTTFADAFNMADEVLYSGVRGVTDLIVMPGLINLDFADIKSVMGEMGKAMMGTGEASGERRSLDAAEAAIANPLLEDTSMKGAKGVLINITGGQDVTLFEVDEAATRIRAEVDSDAHIIVGSAFDPDLDGTMRVSVVATGIDAEAAQAATPTMLNVADHRQKPVVSEVRVLELPEEDSEVQEPVTEEAPETPDIAAEESEAVVEEVVESEAEASSETATSEEEPAQTPLEQLVEQMSVSKEEAETQPEPEAETDEPSDESEEVSEEKQPEPVAEEAKPVAAMPTMGATDAFIPRQPVSASEEPEKKEVDPFRAADMANGAKPELVASQPEEQPAKKPSLFERVTRTGRAAKASTDESTESIKPRAVSGLEVHGFASEQEKTVASSTPMNLSSQELGVSEVVSQPEMAGLALKEEPAPEPEASEEDLLDIPAFLRRQAN